MNNHKKTHTDNGMGLSFKQLLASYQPANAKQLTHNQTLRNLQQLLGDDKLIYITDNIEITDSDTGESRQLSIAGEYVFTANTVAVILHDEHLEPSNLAFYPLNPQAGKPFLLHNDGRTSTKLLQQELDKLEQAGYICQEMEGKKKVIFINPCLMDK